MKIRKFREDAAVKPVDEEENKRIPKPEPEPKDEEKVVEDLQFLNEDIQNMMYKEIMDLKNMIKKLDDKMNKLLVQPRSFSMGSGYKENKNNTYEKH